MENKLFKQDAKQIVDMFFEGKLFKEGVTRDDMNKTEEFVEFLLESRFNSYMKLTELTQRIEKSKHKSNKT